MKAAVICGCIGIVVEVSYEALLKRYEQGWVMEMKTVFLPEIAQVLL